MDMTKIVIGLIASTATVGWMWWQFNKIRMDFEDDHSDWNDYT